MPVASFWDDEEKTIVRGNLVGQWTWDEYHTGISEMAQLVKDIDHRFDQIIDVRESGPLPDGALSHIRRGRQQNPANFGISVIVGPSEWIKALVGVMEKAYGKRTQPTSIAETIEEAYTIIVQQREQE
jgi:hypothetical protein